MAGWSPKQYWNRHLISEAYLSPTAATRNQSSGGLTTKHAQGLGS